MYILKSQLIIRKIIALVGTFFLIAYSSAGGQVLAIYAVLFNE
jgi:hypothetical protein